MKKEVFAALLLLVVVCAAFINIRVLKAVTEEVAALVNAAENHALRGDWTNAKMAAEEAARFWEKR